MSDQRDRKPSRKGGLSRRDFLKGGAAVAAGAALGGGLTNGQGRLLERALAASASGTLGDIEHVVILMQENRSFDHYFGTMRGVRGYLDGTSYSSFTGAPAVTMADIAAQSMEGATFDGTRVSYALADGEKILKPFEIVDNGPTVPGYTLNDITHNWGPQHGVWNDGAMDKWMIEHLAHDPTAKWQLNSTHGIPTPGTSTIPVGIETMGFYRARERLTFYRALANAFTICERYHCSVIGPTHPNRLVSLSGTFGAHSGDRGGVVLDTYVKKWPKALGKLDWPTFPELLTEHGVSWKVYQDPTSMALFNVLPFFKKFLTPATAGQAHNAALALTPQYPAEFAADVLAGTLPKVSWIVPPAPNCEHPATPSEYGEFLVSQILDILTKNSDVWQHTVFLVIYDENGGFFDHVPPPTPGRSITSPSDLPTGAEFDGEYVTSTHPQTPIGSLPSDWYGILGPAGLGFRCPAFVISPFSAGGFVAPDLYDHVSVLKFVEKIFFPTPAIQGNLHVSGWRYGLVGDMTTALPRLTSKDDRVPALPQPTMTNPHVFQESLLNSLAGTVSDGQAYPPPTSNSNDYLRQD